MPRLCNCPSINSGSHRHRRRQGPSQAKRQLVAAARNEIGRIVPVRIVCISDTHALERELTVPSGDLLIHAGDFGFFEYGTRAIESFNEWLGTLPHPYKVVTAGNHEFSLAADPSLRKLIANATVLLNEAAIVGPAKIWASDRKSVV